jgi:hypothetical protein
MAIGTHGTLQNLRITRRSLPYTKLGGIMFYKYEDIKNLLDALKTTKPKALKNLQTVKPQKLVSHYHQISNIILPSTVIGDLISHIIQFLLRYLFYQYFVSSFVVIRAGHLVHTDCPFANSKRCTHFDEGQEIGFALLVGH